MCDPLTIAGIALSAGSVVANNVAAGQAQKARNDALAAERIRQHGLQQEAAALNTQSQDRYQNFTGKQEQRGQELGDYFAGQKAAQGTANAQAAQDMANSTMPATGSNLVVAEEGKQRQNASNFTNAQGEALGNLRSFGDLLGDTSRAQARDASLIGQLGGFMKGSSGVLPYELEAASQKGSGAAQIGQLLGLGGQVGLSAGLGGAKLPNLFGSTANVSNMASTAVARAFDRASVPGYAAYNPYG